MKRKCPRWFTTQRCEDAGAKGAFSQAIASRREAGLQRRTLLPAVLLVFIMAMGMTAAAQSGQINIPLKQWVALAAPGLWPPVGLSYGLKHVTPAYHPPSGRIYFNGGDYTNGDPVYNADQSYQQQTHSLSIAERFADPNNVAAGWRLEYPFCGPSGQIQPYHPDYTGLVWDAKRGLFYMVPGTMEGSADNCPNQANFPRDKMMSFNPVTRQWAIVASTGPAPIDTWMSVLDPVTDTIYRFSIGSTVDMYNIATQTWSSINLPFSVNIWKEYLAADITRRVIYAVDGYFGRLYRFNMDTKAFTDLGPVPGGPLNITNQTYIVWDSVNRVLFYHRNLGDPGSLGFYAYHPDTNTWETLSIASNLPGVNVSGRLMIYDPGQNAILLYGGTESVTQPYLFLYRYGNGSPTTPPSAPTGLNVTAIPSSQINQAQHLMQLLVSRPMNRVSASFQRERTKYAL